MAKMVRFVMHILLPQWLRDKESTCSAGAAGDVGSTPVLGRCLGGGNSNPLQSSVMHILPHTKVSPSFS